MDDDVGIIKLVELIFYDEFITIPEITATNSSIPACLLTEDFSRSLNAVLETKQITLLARWGEFLDSCYSKMFDSPEMYLRYLLFACKVEHEGNQNIFESFINVCVFLRNVAGETRCKTKMDFRHLNPDIFMVFYRNTMKEIIDRRGGYQRLVEFIRGHRYIALSARDDKLDLLGEEIIDNPVFELGVNFDIANDDASAFMALEVLSTTSVAFPTLLSRPELVQCLVAYKRGKETKKDERRKMTESSMQVVPLDKIWEGASKLNSDSKTNRVAERKDAEKSSKFKSEQKEDIAEHENIIEKVVRTNHLKSSGYEKTNMKKLKSEQKEDIAEYEDIIEKDTGKSSKFKSEQKEDIAEYEGIIEKVTRYNRSKSSGHEKVNNSLQKEACGILEHLKYNIESLIGVLDKFDKEEVC